MSLLAAQNDFVNARAALEAAEASEVAARRAFLDALPSDEAEAARAISQAAQSVEVERLRVEKRAAVLGEAEHAERTAAAARRVARVSELRAGRARCLAALGEAIHRAVASRRAFAAEITAVHAAVAAENERVAELRELGQRDAFTDVDVVRHAIGQLIERDAPSEPAFLDNLPALVVGLTAQLSGAQTDEYEAGLLNLRNAFAALLSPTVADFCVAQRLPLPGDDSPMAQNARSAAALLREIEELQ